MDKFQDRYRIPSTRLQKWDYRWAASYFMTICTGGEVHSFGRIENNKMILSQAGIVADLIWYETKNHFPNIELDEFVVMPNHVHGIIIIPKNNTEKHQNINIEIGDDVNTNVETRHALSLQSTPSIQSNIIIPSDSDTQPNPSKIVTIHQNNPIPAKTIGQTRFQNQGKNSVSSIVGSYKSAVTKHVNRLGLYYSFSWQARFYDHIIRDDAEFQKITWYIRHNPSNWTEDKFYK